MQQVAQLMRPLCQQYACPLFVQYEDGESGTVLNGLLKLHMRYWELIPFGKA